MRWLIALYAVFRKKREGKKQLPKSREKGTLDTEENPIKEAERKTIEDKLYKPFDELKSGDIVIHAKWQYGCVVEVEKKNTDGRL